MRVFTRIVLFILGLGLSLIVPTGAALAAPVDVTTRQETVLIVTDFCNGQHGRDSSMPSGTTEVAFLQDFQN